MEFDNHDTEMTTVELLELLEQHDIPHHEWTQKTPEDLLKEASAGESILMPDDEGKLRRRTSVAWVDVFATSEEGIKYHLVEARQEFHDNRSPRTRKLPASLGEKLLVGAQNSEAPFAGAVRALREELGINNEPSMNAIRFSHSAQRQADASSYPGLPTTYTDHFYSITVPYRPEGFQEEQPQKTTYFEWQEVEPLSHESFPERLNKIRDMLPSLASDLVLSRQDRTDPSNQSFARYPDDPNEHAASWHQYGILTHSKHFEQYISDIPRLMEVWSISTPTEAVLAEAIDGIPKGDLLHVVALLHDVGKFTARTAKQNSDDSYNIHFTNHEAHSGAIIRNDLEETLQYLGLSEGQVAYIADCAELHFELGKVRRAADTAYNMAFTNSKACQEAIEKVLNGHPQYGLEIGLMFIADSLSKSEVIATEDTDAAITMQRPELERKIQGEGLNPQLIRQALQVPVNMRVAELYLREWAARLPMRNQ